MGTNRGMEAISGMETNRGMEAISGIEANKGVGAISRNGNALPLKGAELCVLCSQQPIN